jgi:hypothetical protein
MPPKISLCMTTRGKHWLLARTIHWLAKQDLPREDWELIVVDDCSEEPIAPILDPIRDQVQVRDFRLEHSDGWRGITVGMLFAFSQARAEIIAETNSHLLLPSESVRLLLEAHLDPKVRMLYCETTPEDEATFHDNLWVSLRGFTLNTEATEKMDQVDWKSDVAALWQIPETDCAWTKLWLPTGPEGKKFYASHLCCSIRRSVFQALNPWGDGFKDYGTDDPAYAGARRRGGIHDLNVWPVFQMFGHMAHNSHLEDCMELIPSRLNRHGHTTETARFWDTPADQADKPTLEEVVKYWSTGQRTTDWRVREAWGWPHPSPEDYIRRAEDALRAGKTRLEELT